MKCRLLGALAGAALCSIVSRVSMRRFAVAAALALATLSDNAHASAIISSDHINAGESVFISFTPDALDFTNLQPEFPIPPGTRWSYGAVDSAYEGYHSVTAPGSLQDFSFDRFCIGYFICSDGTPDRMVKLTYQTPGDYVIDYSDFYRMSVYYTYLLVWVDDVETGGYFTVFSPGFLQSTDSGSSGSFALTVAAVPEISTWMMMLLGFAGIGLLAYRRRNGHSFKAA